MAGSVKIKNNKSNLLRQKSLAKDPIEVYCRIRPLADPEEPACLKAKDKNTIVLFSSEVPQSSRIIKEVHYSFKGVFDVNTSQKELFERVSHPLVTDVLQGKNGLIFTYGITSSGKSYTMAGSPQDGGLLPRSLDVIFNSIKDYQAVKYVFKPDKLNGFEVQSSTEAKIDQQKEQRVFTKTPMKIPRRDRTFLDRIPDSTVVVQLTPDVNYAIFVSYVEIYNNYIYDLLEESPVDSKRKFGLSSKMLREDASHNMYVFGVTESEVKTVEEALDLFYKGQMMRRVSHTALNTQSSRSHSVFSIRVVQAPLDPQGAEILLDRNLIQISQLSLVDLAGSERSVRTKNTGAKLHEAGKINASLMALRNCIEMLRESQTQGINKKIPYRESKLTHLFKTYFEGEGKLKMVVCVNPQAEYYDETIHVMKFAEMTQDVVISRPVSAPVQIGLAPGRGRVYREAIKKAKEEGVSITEILPPTVYSLGPEFPQLALHHSDGESILTNLIEFLIRRINQKSILEADLERKQNGFRGNLLAIVAENGRLKQVEMDLDGRKQQVINLENKLSDFEQEKNSLEKLLADTQNVLADSRMQVENTKQMLSEQVKENERNKIKMQEKFSMEKDRMRRNMERRCNIKLAELERKVFVKDEIFTQVREILNADDWDDLGEPVCPGTILLPKSETFQPPQRMFKSRSSLEVPQSSHDIPCSEPKFVKTRSSSNFSVRNKEPSIREAVKLFEQENRPPYRLEKSMAVANPRHRRSRSNAGDKWIEHKPIRNLNLGTVLQPSMKNKKSVNELKVKDIVKSHVSKYVLQHQEQDSKGELETKFYKADVIPSAGGGAQVVFNDVEKLQQLSPSHALIFRKRSYDGVLLGEIENRCTVGIENHGNPSKIK